MEILILVLLIANLALGGFIILTINEADRTASKMSVDLSKNQHTILKGMDLILNKLGVDAETINEKLNER